uniref:Fibronectin type-III domain-containing protein n=1 Tax=Poecilia latipinna TaxID=48699 RepID=A0A3B3VF79_9TELE
YASYNAVLYWNILSGHFDGFVVQVSDSEQQSDTLEFRLPGEARNITIPNLMDDTGYDIEVYGISHGRRTPSMFVHAVTGTNQHICLVSYFAMCFPSRCKFTDATLLLTSAAVL